MTEQELLQVPEELRETFLLLEAKGLRPQMCDTPVPYYACGIPCGSPNAIYETAPDGYVLVPRSLVGNNATVIARVTGESMRDAGFEEGDEIHVQLDAAVRDGDIVVACLDGKCTVKGYLCDEDGQVWLVPSNEDYEPIAVTEEMNAHIVGKVIAHSKPTPRVPYAELQKSVNRELARRAKEENELNKRGYTRERLGQMLLEAFKEEAMNSSDWVAVYYVLTTHCGVPSSFKAFADFINGLDLSLPLCKADLLRKADPVYRRPLHEWTPDRAPSVRISVLDKRAAIARRLKEMLFGASK